MARIFTLHKIDPDVYEGLARELCERGVVSEDRLRRLFAERGKEFDPFFGTTYASRYQAGDEMSRADYLNWMLLELASADHRTFTSDFIDAAERASRGPPVLLPLGRLVRMEDCDFEPPPSCSPDEGGFLGGWSAQALADVDEVLQTIPTPAALRRLLESWKPGVWLRTLGQARESQRALVELIGDEQWEQWLDLRSVVHAARVEGSCLGVEVRS